MKLPLWMFDLWTLRFLWRNRVFGVIFGTRRRLWRIGIRLIGRFTKDRIPERGKKWHAVTFRKRSRKRIRNRIRRVTNRFEVRCGELVSMQSRILIEVFIVIDVITNIGNLYMEGRLWLQETRVDNLAYRGDANAGEEEDARGEKKRSDSRRVLEYDDGFNQSELQKVNVALQERKTRLFHDQLAKIETVVLLR